MAGRRSAAEAVHRALERLRHAVEEAQRVIFDYEHVLEQDAAAEQAFGGRSAGRLNGHARRSRSRSRRGRGSRSPGRPSRAGPGHAAAAGGSGSAAAQLEEEIARLNLDSNAARLLGQFPPEQALDLIYTQVKDNIRNPSAFLAAACQRLLDTNRGHASQNDQLEDTIRELGLDESASRILRELPIEQAFYMVDQIDINVRNPSAFIMSLWKKGAGKGKSPSLEDLIRERTSALQLDSSAVRMLGELPPPQAWALLEQIGEDVRNPSAVITAEVRKIVPAGGSGKGSGGGRHHDREGNADVDLTIARLGKEMDLDDSCLES
eukprot:SRR837773.18089.p1 GENE.SRR837773.18089~~SRR837773.18089.p1  ORF type:complete len:333 (-),score=66.84 SRR837773.18089:253-1215(-)